MIPKLNFRIKKLRKSQIKKKAIINTISDLFNFAIKYKGPNRDYILKMIGLKIWEIKLNYKVKLPKEIKRFICRKCKTILIPGYNLIVRNYNHRIEYLCKNCGFSRKYCLTQRIKSAYKNKLK